jgi:hypothetical protein
LAGATSTDTSARRNSPSVVDPKRSLPAIDMRSLSTTIRSARCRWATPRMTSTAAPATTCVCGEQRAAGQASAMNRCSSRCVPVARSILARRAAASSSGSSTYSTCRSASQCWARRAARTSSSRDVSEKLTAARTARGGIIGLVLEARGERELYGRSAEPVVWCRYRLTRRCAACICNCGQAWLSLRG